MTISSSFESEFLEKDQSFEVPLRPPCLADFVGQSAVVERLSILLQAAKKRQEQSPHLLFHGPPGLGKTTLSHIIAKEMGANCVATSGAVLEKAGDLAGILTHLNRHDVLFIDEIHRLPKTLEEYLYPAMEDFSLDLVLDSGPSARSVQLQIEPFTLVAATTKLGSISSPLRSRFSTALRLEYYTLSELTQVLKRTACLLQLEIGSDHLLEIAKRSRGTPRVANHLLRWVRDYALVHNHGIVQDRDLFHALSMLSIDENGLDEMDQKILHFLVVRCEGKPVGLSTLAAALSEETRTLEDVHEPFLLKEGYMYKTARGRVASSRAYQLFDQQQIEKPLEESHHL